MLNRGIALYDALPNNVSFANKFYALQDIGTHHTQLLSVIRSRVVAKRQPKLLTSVSLYPRLAREPLVVVSSIEQLATLLP